MTLWGQMELLVDSQGKEDKHGERSIWLGGGTVIDRLPEWKHGTFQNSQLSFLGAPRGVTNYGIHF